MNINIILGLRERANAGCCERHIKLKYLFFFACHVFICCFLRESESFSSNKVRFNSMNISLNVCQFGAKISSIDIKTTQKRFDIINIDRYTGIHVEEIE